MKDVTELVIIIDKSGSMYGLRKDVVGGFNSLIENQKKEGETLVTTIFFNDEVDIIDEDVNIKDIAPLTLRQYSPSGCTALLDAIGDAISIVKAKHTKLNEDELPKNTIFSIMTDGLENASREYSYRRIKSMINMQKKCGWDFIFKAANIDVHKEADRLGIDDDCCENFIASSEGIKTQMLCANRMINKARNKPKTGKGK